MLKGHPLFPFITFAFSERRSKKIHHLTEYETKSLSNSFCGRLVVFIMHESNFQVPQIFSSLNILEEKNGEFCAKPCGICQILSHDKILLRPKIKRYHLYLLWNRYYSYCGPIVAGRNISSLFQISPSQPYEAAWIYARKRAGTSPRSQ